MDYDDAAEISKSQRKRELQALKDLGLKLLDFSDDSLRQLDLPEKLLEALLTAKKITSNSARKRQLSYVGKLMKEIDPAPVAAIVAAREHQHQTSTREFHLLETLRERLLLEGDAALPEVLAHFPLTDRQHLRKLVRQARSEQAHGQPPGASRRLFRYLRDLQETPEY
ncbi:MAG: ribosome biogenesis factor YjgA [Gammaproteobacteria bacterium]